MGIETADGQMSAFNALMEAVPQIVAANIVRALSYLGEQCVTRVRDRTGEESWFDQTGNLRSSIGYAVINEGRKVIESAFPEVGQGTEGPAEGKRLIDELAAVYSETYAMVVVAGMSYAEYVEAKENKDVLASTELWAKQKVDEYMRKAAERAEKEIGELQKKLGLG